MHTTDNGKEFAAHGAVAKALEALFFFAQPYHSWERGLNEHGLVRQYKATDFRKLDPAELERVETLQPAAQGAGLPNPCGGLQPGVDRGGVTGPGSLTGRGPTVRR